MEMGQKLAVVSSSNSELSSHQFSEASLLMLYPMVFCSTSRQSSSSSGDWSSKVLNENFGESLRFIIMAVGVEGVAGV